MQWQGTRDIASWLTVPAAIDFQARQLIGLPCVSALACAGAPGIGRADTALWPATHRAGTTTGRKWW